LSDKDEAYCNFVAAGVRTGTYGNLGTIPAQCRSAPQVLDALAVRASDPQIVLDATDHQWIDEAVTEMRRIQEKKAPPQNTTIP
jgi:hypothetical protein